jgi:hypothetical protein
MCVYPGFCVLTQYLYNRVQILTTAPSTTDRYFDSKLNPKRIGKWAADRGNREALWEKLVGILGETQE